MAENTAQKNLFTNPVKRIFEVLKLEKNEISAIYFYAILSGLIQLSLPIGIQAIISFVLGGTISASLVFLIVLVVLGVFLAGLLQVNQMKIIEKIQQKIFVRYSFEFSTKIPGLNLQKTDDKYLPELVNRFFDTVSLQKSISKLLLDIPGAMIQILFGLILLCFYHSVFIFFGISLIAIIYLILKTTSAKGMQSSIQESNYKYKVAGWIEEMARVVKSFKFSSNRAVATGRTDQLLTKYLSHRTNHFKVLMQQYWTLIVFKIFITAAMLIVGSFLLINQQLNIGQFIAAEIVILMVIGSVEKLIVNLDNVYDVLTSVDKLSKVTDLPSESNGTVVLTKESSGLAVDMTNVVFSYIDSSNQVTLNGISFSARPSEKICVMGKAGSGKSTLIKLLTGAYKNYKGVVSVNNLSINNYDLFSLRTQTGILFSQLDIFEGTLLENITMGAKDFSVNDIIYISEKVGLKSYISSLPDGFETMINPIGKKLPQKIIQKILLLRALVNRPRLLLLEEPFEGLEEQEKQSIISYLLDDSSNATLFVCSNDEQFAAQCDKVIYLEEGEIKAIGKWSEIAAIIR